MDTLSRFNRFWFVFLVPAFILLSSPVNAQSIPAYDPSDYEKIFGKPEDFIKKLEDDISPKLNEYLGLGVSVSGFILVIRSLIK
ncbi:MAG: hypothetical protein ICV54_19610 [Nostoc sp. C3-bin3]|nr:hypothetical protein [Nostoc sp. C3-bin3]